LGRAIKKLVDVVPECDASQKVVEDFTRRLQLIKK
jgi:hypothetical protein